MPAKNIAEKQIIAAELKTMADAAKVYANNLIPFREGDAIEVEILQKSRTRIVVDVTGYNLGFIPEKEFSFDAADLKPGDRALATILSMENDAGYVVLSLKRADKERIWQTLQDNFSTGKSLKTKIKSANRGGLMVEFGSQEGFLPVSQLAPIHYPKVEGGDSNKILAKLKTLVGQVLLVKVITFDRQTNRLIFSEKAVEDDRLASVAAKLKVGEVVAAIVSGVVDFGVFVKVPFEGEIVEGLIHVSEISWEPVKDLQKKFRIDQELKAMVINVDKSKVSLSLKRLEKDPWDKVGKTLAVGQKVDGLVTNVTPFGAFVKLKNGLDALLHISQIKEQERIEPGKSHSFYVLSIDAAARKISLSMKKSDKKKEKINEKK